MKYKTPNIINQYFGEHHIDDASYKIYKSYKKVIGIVEQTHIAMGKRKVIKTLTASASSENLLVHGSKNTH